GRAGGGARLEEASDEVRLDRALGGSWERTVVKIRSIDGGGSRGIVPAVVLAELERRTGQPIARLFDLIAGTSTGGLITFALTCPGPDGEPRYSATQLVGIYEREGPAICARSLWRRIV